MGNPVGAGLLSAAVLSTFLPDIVIGMADCKSDDFTEVIYSNVFHELSHASHFFGIGDLHAQMMWLQEYIEMAGGWLKAIVHGKSPIDDPYTGDTDLIRLIETWGYFDEFYAMMWRFAKYEENVNQYKNKFLDGQNNNSKPKFSYPGFYKLTIGEGSLNTYSVTQIFYALKCPSVKSLNLFAEKLADKDDVKNVKNNNKGKYEIMKKVVFIILSILLIFISCEPPFPGFIYCYKIEFNNSDLCNGNIDVNISGKLTENHKNPVLHIYIRNGSKNISTDLYELSGDYENLTHLIDSEKSEYLIWLGDNDINYNMRIHMKQTGKYELWCFIRTDKIDENNFDSYSDFLEFSYE